MDYLLVDQLRWPFPVRVNGYSHRWNFTHERRSYACLIRYVICQESASLGHSPQVGKINGQMKSIPKLSEKFRGRRMILAGHLMRHTEEAAHKRGLWEL